tara:strand:- start:259 stop:762 length:504 start_codon:yes stop_codon:yes gene_type:complete
VIVNCHTTTPILYSAANCSFRLLCNCFKSIIINGNEALFHIYQPLPVQFSEQRRRARTEPDKAASSHTQHGFVVSAGYAIMADCLILALDIPVSLGQSSTHNVSIASKVNARSPTLTVEIAAIDYSAKLIAKISLKRIPACLANPKAQWQHWAFSFALINRATAALG